MKRQTPKFGPSDYQDLALIESIKRGNQASFTTLYKKYHPIWERKLYFALGTVSRLQKERQEDAKDIASEIFQKLYENIHKYKKEYAFNAWFSSMAKNYFIDYLRKRKKSLAISNALSIDTPTTFDDGSQVNCHEINSGEPDAMTPSETLEHQAKLKVAYSAIENLPKINMENLSNTTQYVFKKFNDDGKTPYEISVELGMKIEDVEDHIKLAFKRQDQGKLEQQILELYYIYEMNYDDIAKKLGMNINTMKVTLMRARTKVIESIDLRKAVIEVASTYTLEQLNINKIYKLDNLEGEISL